MKGKTLKRRSSANFNPICKIFVCKDFTLIELLVVIAIIAILASILLPALSKAKEVSKNIVCVGQLKQYAQASISYAEDFNGWGHPYVWNNTSGTAQYNPNFLHYAGYINLPYQRLKYIGASGFTITFNGNAFLCPNFPLKLEYDTYASSGQLGYGTNYTITFDRTPTAALKKMLTVPNPSKTFIWVDGTYPIAFYNNFLYTNSQRVAPRHGHHNLYYDPDSGHANYSFVDGHVDAFNSKTVTGNVVYN